jgi:hypothetical protein
MRASCAPSDAGRAGAPFGALRQGRGPARLALLSLAMMIVSLDQYIVVVALPEIGAGRRPDGWSGGVPGNGC